MPGLSDAKLEKILERMRDNLTKKQWAALYAKYLKTSHWLELREAVKERCYGYCEKCEDKPVAQVHHLTYIRLGNERLEDLQGLCGGCHKKAHNIKKKKKKQAVKNGPRNRGAETQRITELTNRVDELEETVNMLTDKISHLI